MEEEEEWEEEAVVGGEREAGEEERGEGEGSCTGIALSQVGAAEGRHRFSSHSLGWAR